MEREPSVRFRGEHYSISGVHPGPAPSSDLGIQGMARQWADQLVSVVRDYGMNGFVYWPDADHQRQITEFAQEVVPAMRAALAQGC
nr:hypothetical protein [Streptomyces sp. NEAU-YJ-81]